MRNVISKPTRHSAQTAEQGLVLQGPCIARAPALGFSQLSTTQHSVQNYSLNQQIFIKAQKYRLLSLGTVFQKTLKRAEYIDISRDSGG